MSSNDTIVRLSVDATGVKAGTESATRNWNSYIATQEAAAARTAAAQQAIQESISNASQASTQQVNKFIQSIAKQAEAAGKTRAELLQMQAAALGVSNSAQAYIDKIADASKHTEELSFKSAGARRELLVLAHEASQGNWKNFGGSILVLGERIDAMSLIFSAAGLSTAVLAGGLAAVAIAAIKGAEEAKQFNAALVLTNNYAGLTRDSLASMAEAVSGSSGASLSKSNEVLLNLAQSGKLTSTEMSGLADVILRTAAISGEKLEEVSKEYAKLADDPAKWAAEHNASMHFMDVATYQHIQALQEAGDKHKAIQAVIEATAAQVENSSTAHLSAAAKAWDNLSSSVQTFWAKLKQGLSTGASLQDQIDTLTGERNDIKGNVFSAGRIAEIDQRIAALKRLQRAQADNADLQSANAQRQQQGIEAAQRIDKLRDQMMTNAERREKDLAKLAKDRQSILAAGGQFSDSDYARMVSDINEKYKDPKQPKAKAFQDDSGTRMLQSLRDQQAALEAQLSTTAKLTNAESELAKFDQQIADWKNKTLTPQQQSLIKDQDAIRAQLQKNVELEKEVKHRDDLTKLQERSAQLDASIASYQKGQNDQYGRQLDAFGMGSDALKNVQAVKSIYSEYQRLQEQLDKATPKDLLGGSDYQDASAKIKSGLDQSLADYDAYYASLKAKQADWTNGATAGLANYLDAAHNMASETETAFNDVTRSMEDALTSFVTSGRLNFKSFADSLIADIIRIQARAAISGLFSGALSAAGSYFGNGAATFAANVQGGNSLDNLVSNTGGWGTIPARASGGSVDSGTTYLVGEKGPELFVPGASGTIVPNHALSSSSASGGGLTINAPISINSSGDAEADKRNAGDLNKKITAAIQSVLVNERRQGGVLWKMKNGVA